MKLCVRRQWNDYRVGQVNLADVGGLHWTSISGGVQSVCPQPFIHGYVSCALVEGDIPHSCRHGSGPHSIKVVVVKKDNSNDVWEAVNAIAGPKPER